MLPFQRQPIVAALTLMLLSGAIPAVAEEDAVSRGEYLVRAGGCSRAIPLPASSWLEGERSLPRLAPSTVRTSQPTFGGALRMAKNGLSAEVNERGDSDAV